MTVITFNEVKRQANIGNHGFDFMGCTVVFEGFTTTPEDVRDAYGELRLQPLGRWNGVVMSVVHAACADCDRIISILKAEKHEERIYWKNYPSQPAD